LGWRDAYYTGVYIDAIWQIRLNDCLRRLRVGPPRKVATRPLPELLWVILLSERNRTDAAAADLDAKVPDHGRGRIALIGIVEQLGAQNDGRVGDVAADVASVVAGQLQVAAVPELVSTDRRRLVNLHITRNYRVC